MSGERQTIFYGYDEETVAEVLDDELKVEWANIDEGYNGDYNPDDSNDVELLRFYVYFNDDGEWEPVENASYCTNMPLHTPQEILEASLEAIFSRYKDEMGGDPYAPVKNLGEELSWISPDSFR